MEEIINKINQLIEKSIQGNLFKSEWSQIYNCIQVLTESGFRFERYHIDPFDNNFLIDYDKVTGVLELINNLKEINKMRKPIEIYYGEKILKDMEELYQQILTHLTKKCFEFDFHNENNFHLLFEKKEVLFCPTPRVIVNIEIEKIIEKLNPNYYNDKRIHSSHS